ncbi:MAG: DUF4166 domain-containing protein [Thalassovita sp.]
MTKRIVVVGGYGVFGGILAQSLGRDANNEVLVAGRSLAKATDFCVGTPCHPIALDLTAQDLEARLAALAPQIVIDAAGPFQSYANASYALARGALAAGAHYIDLSDDAAFSAGISTLDAQAQAAGLCVISGASSVPGLSSAAVSGLTKDGAEITRIETVILPGNRAPRGLSVIRAILAQAGKPIGITQAGQSSQVLGWSAPRRQTIRVGQGKDLSGRWASYIGAPDLDLFAAHFGAKTVRFRAGLELPVMHLGLWALSLLVRWKVLASLEPFAKSLRRVAQWLEPFGSDRGAMEVSVLCQTTETSFESRTWAIVAEAGDGPNIPTLAAQILCHSVMDGTVSAGARPCLSLFDLTDVEAAAGHLSVAFATHSQPETPLFRQALGPAYDQLPKPVQQMHSNMDVVHWQGDATVETGNSWLARLARRLVGFPEQSDGIPVSVTMRRDADAEIWERRFGAQKFHSVLTLGTTEAPTGVFERFGPMRFLIALSVTPQGLAFPVKKGWFLGVPMPRFLLPKSSSIESEKDGDFHFDVALSLPFVGLMVRYVGTLTPSPMPDPSGDR